MNGEEIVEVWGTGIPIREFIYVQDAAEGIVRATEMYDDLSPLNIGTGIGTSIKELVDLIISITGYKGELYNNTDQPDGQKEKVLDVTKMKDALDWQPKTSLQDGLQKTISWFENNYEKAVSRW